MSANDHTGNEIRYWRQREADQRQISAGSQCLRARDLHFILAERYADKAWSLSEDSAEVFIPSGLWPARDMIVQEKPRT